MKLLVGGLAAGAITVLICTSKAFAPVRKLAERVHPIGGQLLNCCFCTSWWVSLAMLEEFTLKQWAATVAIANLAVLVIHMSIASVEED
jgi:hypothetical protein